jgi:hypothetical protein
MKTPLVFALAATACAAGCSDNSSKPAQTAATNSTSSSVLTAPVDYLGALGKSKQTATKTVDIASLNQAVQMFQVEKGRLPKNLDELVEENIIGRLPKPPYGMKFDYNAATGEVKVVPQ